jgi:hypothetical protein
VLLALGSAQGVRLCLTGQERSLSRVRFDIEIFGPSSVSGAGVRISQHKASQSYSVSVRGCSHFAVIAGPAKRVALTPQRFTNTLLRRLVSVLANQE